VLSWLARDKKIEDILMGVHHSIVARSLGLMRRVGIEPEVTFTGGVARNIGMVHVLNAALGFTVNVSEDSHFMGALGAALFGLDRVRSGSAVRAGRTS
jgi:activator of 2-hydroxyglutaryl-CoA dehydratase